MDTLDQKYRKEIAPQIMKEMNITNVMAVPKLTKVVINCGLGEALQDKKVIEKMAAQLSIIGGQKPQVTKAKRAISTFKLRAGDTVGLKITLRGKRMYDFVKKLIAIALPRVRDFRGISRKSFDGNGNYTLAILEQNIFPELEYSLIDKMRGFEITFVTSARTNEEGMKLLELLGLPFEKR